MVNAGDGLQGTESGAEAEITVGLLNAVAANSHITQRSLARELDIALGLANAYLKRCVRKGWVKVNTVPANRYAYYLTPQGFAAKSRLTAEYLSISFDFFRSARKQCAEVLEYCSARGWDRIAFAGTGDLAEIAVLCAAETSITLVGFLDQKERAPRFAGLPVVQQLDLLPKFDAIIVTDFRRPQDTYDILVKAMPVDRVLTPKLLRISREPLKLMEQDDV
jgi:DNA-binding MarR family transcriptional regulator